MTPLPPEVDALVTAAERGQATAAGRRWAAGVLLRHYANRSLLTGAALWSAVAGSVLLCAVGAMGALGPAVWDDPWWWLVVGLAGLAAGAAALAWSVRRGIAQLRAGGRLTRAVEAWLSTAPSPQRDVAHQVHGVLSALRPELYARGVLGGVTALGAILGASVVGYSFWQAAGRAADLTAVVLNVVLAATAAALTVVFAVPSVAMYRGSRRVQRGLVHDPAGGS